MALATLQPPEVRDASQPPEVRDGLVNRPRLVRRLTDERGARTAVITAPAGYGKSSLLAEWAREDARPLSWIALSAHHDEPAELLWALLVALNSLETIDKHLLDAGQRAVREGTEEQLSALRDEIALLVGAMGGTRRPGILVLDDVHLVKTGASLGIISTVAKAVPSGTKLALTSRTSSPLRLGRLRAEQDLLELGVRDMAMTTYEAHHLLRAAGLELDRRAVDRLVARTEGWPAALSLAAGSLRDRADRDTAVESFGGRDPAIREYVQDEILSPLAEPLRRFLQRCSVLDQFSASLCQAVLDTADSPRALQTLTSRSLMLLPLDSNATWYRCNSLVRDVLQEELELCDPDEIPPLHERASRWFTKHGDTERAIQHAVAAHKTERVGELLWRYAPDYVMRGRELRVHRWLGSFTEDEIASSPHLALFAAFHHLDEAKLSAAERWARAAASALRPTRTPSADRRETASLDAGITLIGAAVGRGGVDEMAQAATHAHALLGTDDPWRGPCRLLQGVAAHLTGDRVGARELLGDSLHLSATMFPAVESLCDAQLAIMDGEDGDWERAHDHATVAVERLSVHGLGRLHSATLVFAVSAWVAAHRHQADEAKRDLRVSDQLLRSAAGLAPWYAVETMVIMARTCTQLAEVVRARALLAQASRSLRSMPDAETFHTWLDDAWADIDELSASALAGPGSLTMAELRILRFLPTHLSVREIGEHLHVSTNTVKSQAQAVYSKLDASSRSEAVARASALGLIEVSII
jgi:LuxR family transcriptional regulator, maltose regulon positive regulatory protein